LLDKEYRSLGFQVFDVVLDKAPEHVSPEVADFWGGYRLEFKLIEMEKVGRAPYNAERMRRQAAVTGPGQKRKFMIEISKREYCRDKVRRDLEGYAINVYSPEMIVCEKLRAICQQMPEYEKVVPAPSRSARARGFFDIVVVMEKCGVDLASPATQDLISKVFAAKRVPLSFMKRIPDYREFHRRDFTAVLSTLNPGEEAKEFDSYFDYVVDRCRALETLWKV
jgi:hypothetical protein